MGPPGFALPALESSPAGSRPINQLVPGDAVTMTIDPQTLTLLLVLAMMQAAGALFFLAIGHPLERGVRHAGFALLCQITGVGLLALGPRLPSLVSLGLGGLLLLGGACYLLIAIRLFHGRRIRTWHPLLAGALVIPAVSSLLVLQGQARGQAALASLLLGAAALGLAFEFLRKSRDEVWVGPRWLCLAGLSQFGVVALLSSLALYRASSLTGPLGLQPSGQHLLLAAVGLYATLGLGLALMLAQRLEARQQRFAQSDLLTGLSNRQGFEAYAGRVLARARPLGQFTSLLLMEVDHFEEINRTCGRGTGDLVLETLGDLLHQQLRERDGAGRFQEGEMAVLLPDTHHSFAQPVAERVRRAIEALELTWEGRTLAVTASFGVASTAEVDSDLTALFQLAAARLERARTGGHNRVVAE